MLFLQSTGCDCRYLSTTPAPRSDPKKDIKNSSFSTECKLWNCKFYDVYESLISFERQIFLGRENWTRNLNLFFQLSSTCCCIQVFVGNGRSNLILIVCSYILHTAESNREEEQAEKLWANTWHAFFIVKWVPEGITPSQVEKCGRVLKIVWVGVSALVEVQFCSKWDWIGKNNRIALEL